MSRRRIGNAVSANWRHFCVLEGVGGHGVVAPKPQVRDDVVRQLPNGAKAVRPGKHGLAYAAGPGSLVEERIRASAHSRKSDRRYRMHRLEITI